MRLRCTPKMLTLLGVRTAAPVEAVPTDTD